MTLINVSNNIPFRIIAELKANLSTSSSHKISSNNRIFITNLLFTSFTQLKTNLSTISSHTTSPNNRIFITNLLFTSFAQFKTNLSTTSSHTTSSNKRIFSIDDCIGINIVYWRKYWISWLSYLSPNIWIDFWWSHCSEFMSVYYICIWFKR